MRDSRLLPHAFYFRLQALDGGGGAERDMAFQDVSGISVEIEPETVTEGGVNTHRHRLPTTPKYDDLVLKRGYVTDTLPLFQWCQTTLQNGFAKRIQPKTLSLQLLSPADSGASPEILRHWTFYGVWPTKWNVSEFGSNKNEIVIETLRLAYRYFDSR